MAVQTTACPRNCYSTCTMQVHVEGGRIRRIDPHPDNAATPDGVCLKGLSYVERVVSPDRILTPLRRTSAAGFEPVSWDEALDRIVSELKRLQAEPGPQSVLYYAASGTKGLLNGAGAAFWRAFGGYTTTYGDLCWPAGLEATRLTLGESKHNAPWDLQNAKLIVLWGKNSAETNIHQMTHLARAQERGALLVVIDPRRTETSERADLFIQPRPGTDGALALGVAHALESRGGTDREFVDRNVLGHDAFREMLGEYPPGRAAEIAGIPVEQVDRLAGYFAEIRPATISAGYGMQRYTNSGQTMRAILALLVLTGNIGRPGAGWQFANLQSAIFDDVKDPVAFYPPAAPDGVARISISTARLGRDMLATEDPPLRMAWVERGNPATQNPETGKVLEAFRALDFRVVVEQFLTDTAREADIILPAKTMFEQSDVIGAYWHPYIQFKQKVVDPPGEVKPETEIYTLLAERLGIATAEFRSAVPGPTDADVEAWLEARLAPFPGLSLDRLRRGPVVAPGHEEVAFADRVFPTPSGKIELVSQEASRRWGVEAVPRYSESEESVRGDSVRAERYPLYLMTPNTKDRIHSQFGNLRMIRAVSEGPRIRMHPDDAGARGIGDGDRVRVHNDRGALEIEARIDLGLRAGCVSITNGWWSVDGGAVNVCSMGRETDMGHGAAFHDNLVQVEKAG